MSKDIKELKLDRDMYGQAKDEGLSFSDYEDKPRYLMGVGSILEIIDAVKLGVDMFDCRVCFHYTRGYLRHLHKSNELLACSLSTFHNLAFMFNFMKKIRKIIMQGDSLYAL